MAVKQLNEGAGGVASYVLLFEGAKPEHGYIIDDNTGDICHARLSKAYRGLGNGVCVAVYDAIRYHEKAITANRAKIYKRYVDYIINRSPWAVAHLEKDIDVVWDKGANMNVNVHGDILAAACVVARVGYEFSSMLDIFEDIVDAGFDENVAWLIAVSFTKVGKKYVIAEMGGGHHVIRADLRTDALLSFMKAGYRPDLIDTTEPYRVRQTYRITEPMQETKVCVKAAPLNWKGYIDITVEKEVEGEGFDADEYVSKKSLIKFAEHLQKIIKG